MCWGFKCKATFWKGSICVQAGNPFCCHIELLHIEGCSASSKLLIFSRKSLLSLISLTSLSGATWADDGAGSRAPDWNQTSEGRRWPAPTQFKVTRFKQPSPPYPMAFKAQTALLPGAGWGSAGFVRRWLSRGESGSGGPLHPALPGPIVNQPKATPPFDFWQPISATSLQLSVRAHTQRILSRNTVNSHLKKKKKVE